MAKLLEKTAGKAFLRKLGVSLLLSTPLLFSTVATNAEAGTTKAADASMEAEKQAQRYELNRSDTLLLMNIDAEDQIQEKVNFLHLENIYTGQTYRLKMRSGTHLLKLEAGVYKADLERMNRQMFSSDKNQMVSSSNTEITLMPQSVNFAGTWKFSGNKKSASLEINNSNNPAVAVAKKYPIIAGYPLRSIKKNSSQMVALEWPFNEDEMLSLTK